MEPEKGIVVIPARNEGLSLGKLLPRLQEVIQGMQGKTIEVVVIDDGSTDNTSKVARQHGCQVLSNQGNRGVGFSVKRGCQLALKKQCDFLVSMDADGQHDTSFLPLMLLHLNQAEVVIASRYHEDSQRINVPLDRDLLNVAVRAMLHAVTGWSHLTDPLSGFWAMRRPVIKFLAQELQQEGYGVFLEGLVKLWHLYRPRPTIVEVPHPAIYTFSLPTRDYSPGNRERRLERFSGHAAHILAALEDIQPGHSLEGPIEGLITSWRKRELSGP